MEAAKVHMLYRCGSSLQRLHVGAHVVVFPVYVPFCPHELQEQTEHRHLERATAGPAFEKSDLGLFPDVCQKILP